MSTDGRIRAFPTPSPGTQPDTNSHPLGQPAPNAGITLAGLIAAKVTPPRARIAGEILLRDERRYVDLVRLGQENDDHALDRVHSERYGELRTFQIRAGEAVK